MSLKRPGGTSRFALFNTISSLPSRFIQRGVLIFHLPTFVHPVMNIRSRCESASNYLQREPETRNNKATATRLTVILDKKKIPFPPLSTAFKHSPFFQLKDPFSQFQSLSSRSIMAQLTLHCTVPRKWSTECKVYSNEITHDEGPCSLPQRLRRVICIWNFERDRTDRVLHSSRLSSENAARSARTSERPFRSTTVRMNAVARLQGASACARLRRSDRSSGCAGW